MAMVVDNEFDFTQVLVFQLEDKLIRAPRAIFHGSSVFQHMFELPQDQARPVDGSDDSHPLRLESIKISDFKLFMRVAMFETYHGGLPDLSISEWLTVLEFTVMWEMENLRSFILNQLPLSFTDDDAASRIHLAEKYAMPGMFYPAVTRLVCRHSPPSAHDVRWLGHELAATIFRLRERNRSQLVAEKNLEQFRTLTEKYLAETCTCKLREYVGDMRFVVEDGEESDPEALTEPSHIPQHLAAWIAELKMKPT